MARRQKPVSEDAARLRELRALVRQAHGSAGLRAMDPARLARLPKLYRFASSLIARLESSGADRPMLNEARQVLVLAHNVLYRDVDRERTPLARRAARWFLAEVPRALRAEWRLLSVFFVILYALAGAAWFAVSQELELAYSLMHPGAVSNEIEQLRATEAGEPFRGNFTFGLSESPHTAGWIMLHNMGVGVLFFGTALVPPLFLQILGTNALMLGTYTGVASHWGQAGAISSILWCHGTLEIQAIVIAGAGGLVLVRALVAPGPWTRRHALARESRQALKLLSATFPMLFLAGLIEGFISPHAPFGTRVMTAVATGVLFLVWVLFGGRGSDR